MLQRFNENRWLTLTAFPLKILDNVSSSGSDAGITASSHRERDPKGTKVSNLYEYFKLKFLTILGIIGSPLINFKYEHKASRGVGQLHIKCSNYCKQFNKYGLQSYNETSFNAFQRYLKNFLKLQQAQLEGE